MRRDHDRREGKQNLIIEMESWHILIQIICIVLVQVDLALVRVRFITVLYNVVCHLQIS